MALIMLEALGHVGIIRLDPRRRVPVLDQDTLRGLERALEEARAASIRSIVLAGGKEGVFAAGADLKELARLDSLSALGLARRGQLLLEKVEASPAIVVAAVSGKCIGGAFDLVMACDLRVADESATFEHPGPKMGFITGWGGTSRLPRLAGPSAGPILSGLTTLNAAQALEVGLVTEVVPGDRLEARCMQVAREIASAGETRIRLVKRSLVRLSSFRGSGILERRWTALRRSGDS